MTKEWTPTDQSPPGNRSATIVSLQILRAVAAVMVVMFHVFPARPGAGAGAVDRADVLNSGVDLFFLISGFIMVWITSQGSRNPTRFLESRFLRVVPLYWLATLSWLAVIQLTGSAFPKPSEIALSLAFIPYFNQAGDPMPVLGVGWTLNYEVLFYLLFAVTMFIRPAWQVIVLAGIFVGLVALRPVVGTWSGAGFRFTSPLFLEFIMGAALAFAFPRFKRLPMYVGVASLIAGVFLLLALSGYSLPRFISKGGPHLFIMAGALILEPFFQRSSITQVLRPFGDASYSIYLFHGFALTLVPLWLPSSTTWSAGWLLMLTAAIGTGLIVHRFIEKPLTGVSHRRPKRNDKFLGMQGENRSPS